MGRRLADGNSVAELRLLAVLAQRLQSACGAQAAAYWMSAGLAAAALSRWVVLALLTRTWSVAEVGGYVLPVMLATPLMQFARLRMRCLQASDAGLTQPFPVIWRLTELTSLAACVLVGGFAAWLYSWPLALTTLIVAAGLFCESLSELCFGTLLQRERTDWIAASLLIRSALLVVATAVAASVSRSVLWLAAGQSLVQLGMLCLWDLPARRRFDGSAAAGIQQPVTYQALRDLLALAWPLATASLCTSLAQAAPRFFLERWRGLAELGLLAVLGTILVPGNIFLLGMTQTAVPPLARAALDGDHQRFWRRLSQLYLAAAATCAATVGVFVACGDALLTAVYSASYAGHPELLHWILAACAAAYWTYALVTPFVAQQRFRELLVISAGGLATTILACWLLVPAHGAQGAAWAMLCGSVIVDAALAARTPACLRAVRRRAQAARPRPIVAPETTGGSCEISRQ